MTKALNIKLYQTDDEKMRAVNKKLIITARIIFIACLVCMFAASTFLSYNIVNSIDIFKDYALHILKICALVVIASVFIIIEYLPANIIYRRLLLRAYGWHKGVELWVINFDERTAYKAKPFGVEKIKNEFNDTLFSLFVKESNGNGGYYSIHGKDIYFSKSSAESVLKYIEAENGEAIKQYYPKWQQDTDFILYYKQWQNRKLYLGKNKYELIDMFIVTPVTINGFKYEPEVFALNANAIEILLEDYIETKKEQKNKEKRTRRIKEQLSKLDETG